MRNERTFGDLIAPVTPRRFMADYWEKKFLHRTAREGQTFDSVFSLADVDRWLASTRSERPDGVLLIPPEGEEGTARRHRPQDVEIANVYEAFARGSSVVLNRLEVSWPPVAPLVAELAAVFSAFVGVNAYLTPKGSRTFPRHVDQHDVFALQIHGEKVWSLHEIALVPLEKLEYERDLEYTSSWGEDRIQTPQIAEVRLRPGDFLYVPRGMPHQALARDSASLHLTFSVVPFYWTDFLKAAVEQASVHAPELRRSLPPGFVHGEEPHETMRQEIGVVLEAFQKSFSFEETFGVLERSRVRRNGFTADGHFAHLERLAELSAESLLEKREGVLCTVDTTEYGFSNIRFGSQHVRAPARIRGALEFIRDAQVLKVSEIPGLNNEGRLVLARRLIREGLLRFAETARPEAAGEVEPRVLVGEER